MASSAFTNETWQQSSPPRPHLVSLDGEPAFPTTPVLSLELGNISKMSKGGREGLSYMWTVFSRCKESIRDGRRLENLSWRLWYEDLKLTGCVSSSSDLLSDLDSEESSSVNDDNDEEKLLDVDMSEDESADEKQKLDSLSDEKGDSKSPQLIDGLTETLEPSLSRGPPQQGKQPVVVTAMEGKGRLKEEEQSQGPALNSATLSSTSSTSKSSPSRMKDNSTTPAPTVAESVTPPTSTAAQAAPSSLQTSPSKHLRRSSCPASRDRDMLRISRTSSAEREQGVGHAASKKEKRALSFANAHRPASSHHHHPPQRLARAMPPLTPETIQGIIGTVLPMNFKSSPRIRLCSPPLPTISNTARAAPLSVDKPPSAEPQREQSVKSEKSYFTSTTAFSDSGVDTVFSPQLESRIRSPLPPSPSSSHPDAIEVTTSAPQQTIVEADDPVPIPRLTQSEETRIVDSPSPDLPSNGEEQNKAETEVRNKASGVAPPSMQRNSSHHKIAVKPALLTRGKTSSASSTRLHKSALQRTQSAKSVRIMESPTEADGAALEDKSEGATANTTAAGPSQHTTHHQTHSTNGHAHTQHSKTTVKHAHIAPKRTLSSSRLKGHTRNASSTSLHREGRMKSPPPIPETQSPDSSSSAAAVPATAVSKTAPTPAPAAAERPQERTELMQAAPHVTKAINIRRNNSSLANLIKTEPRSVSRGFDVPPSSSANDNNTANDVDQQRTTSQQITEQGNSVSSPSSTAIAAAAVQSVPDNAPPLHPPPPSPASPVIMVPSSVILPPQPRSSPADPRFRVHSTIRRPPSPPLLEEEQDDAYNFQSDRPLSPSKSDRDMMITRKNAREDGNEKEKIKLTPKRAETMPPYSSNGSSTAPRDMKSEPQQLTNAKKKQMFFFSSPTTDSDDEGQPGSFKFRAAAPLPVDSMASDGRTGKDAKPEEAQAGVQDRNTRTNGKPAIKVVQVTSPTENEQKKNNANTGEHQHSDDDDDEYEDEDNSDEWSSEASDSEEDEQQAAIRREEERQRLMFAKRTPSMVATQGGLLSKLLRPEEYSHGSANMPVHLRNNASAMHLKQLPSTGLLASKSTAALPALKAAQPSSRLVPTKSGNHLTRLGGAPSGVELESDDDDDDQAMPEISPTQQKKLNALMQRTTSSQGKTRNTSPPRPQEPPLAQVTRVTSAAQIAMQPEPTNIFTPRTTRRNMLSTELTESLRASLLAERNRNRPGIERIVSAFGTRFGAGSRQQQQQQQQQQVQAIQQTQAHQPDFAPSERQPPPQLATASAPLQPPRIQRGSTGFTPAASKQGSNAGDRLRPGLNAAGRLPPNTRANSDPPQQTEYYSPGFHHTGW